MARNNLKSARQAKGLTQQAVADALYMSLRQYKNIEAGTSGGRIDMWDTLEDMLSVNQRVLREIDPGTKDSR